jgi:hypothetical protein
MSSSFGVRSVSILPLALLLASPVHADPARGDTPPAGEFGVAASVQYAFHGTDESRHLLPALSLGNQAHFAVAPAPNRLLLRYGLDVGATIRPENPVDLARSLLLPGAVALMLGAGTGIRDRAGARVVIPEVSVGAKFVPWHDDTAAMKVGISGGLEFSANQRFDASIQLTRAVNAIGERGQQRLLAATHRPDLWASDFSATAAVRSKRHDLGVFGAFGAYLFDSKFHVPPEGRRVFSLGVRKAFG